jgi:hypothetical protein
MILIGKLSNYGQVIFAAGEGVRFSGGLSLGLRRAAHAAAQSEHIVVGLIRTKGEAVETASAGRGTVGW